MRGVIFTIALISLIVGLFRLWYIAVPLLLWSIWLDLRYWEELDDARDEALRKRIAKQLGKA